MKQFSFRLSSVLLSLGLLLGLGGCNTIQGIGKDVQKAGETVQDAAKKK
jgi:predicted small secreted protein